MNSIIKIFGVSIFVTIAAVITGLFYHGWGSAITILALIVIEVTFSFDNAVVNARILRHMSEFWQKIFLTIGILVAVFGMRLVFPIVIVMLAVGMGWSEVINLALYDPAAYSQHLHDAHLPIALFGGMFLLMLSVHFFTDSSREVLWLKRPEAWLQKFDKVYIRLLIAILPLVILAIFKPDDAQQIFTLGLAGAVTYSVIHHLTDWLMEKQAKKKLVQATGMAGFMSFMYLEVLDASLSFDGVIGAFAITKEVILIALGLGVGAFWVRSLTIYLVRHKILQALRYLEHGAFYTITMLALMLLASIFIQLPEALTGLLGIFIIGAAFVASRRAGPTKPTKV